jgi:hypothetical protein
VNASRKTASEFRMIFELEAAQGYGQRALVRQHGQREQIADVSLA